MAGIRLPVLTLVLLLALQQVQAEPWTVWACEGSSDSQSYPPGSGQVCCKYEGDGEGTFTIRKLIDCRLGLSAPGVRAGAPLVRTGSCPGFTGDLKLSSKGINHISPDAFDECGAR